jgi:exodeoxyribonuclease X
MSTYMIADTETASLEGGVADIGVRHIDEDLNILWENESLVDPERPISPSASGIHHIVDSMVWDAPTLKEWSAMHDHPFAHEDLVIIGHNIRFDERMLAELMPQSYHRICTLKLTRAAFPDLPDHKLQTIRYAFNLTAGTAHRALGDVITCHSLLPILMGKLGTDLPGLVALSHKPMDPDTPISFGKHKGTALKSLPKQYVNWLLDPERSLDPDLRDALTAIFR